MCALSASLGNLSALQWLRNPADHQLNCSQSNAILNQDRREGFPWDSDTCSQAASGGHLSILQWARSRGCPWDSDTCASASLHGHLEVLQWARSQGCPDSGHVI